MITRHARTRHEAERELDCHSWNCFSGDDGNDESRAHYSTDHERSGDSKRQNWSSDHFFCSSRIFASSHIRHPCRYKRPKTPSRFISDPHGSLWHSLCLRGRFYSTSASKSISGYWLRLAHLSLLHFGWRHIQRQRAYYCHGIHCRRA